MEVLDYYYKILDLNKDATKEDVYNAYKMKIEKYRNLPFLNTNQKNEIKDLKKAKYVLADEELKKKYDLIIDKNEKESTKMKDWERQTSRKDKVDSQLVSDRIFQMAGILNIPQKNLNIDRTFFQSTATRKELNETKNNRLGDDFNRQGNSNLNNHFDNFSRKDKEETNKKEFESINYDMDNFSSF